MQHEDKYSLTWHSFSDHLREALKEMLTSSDFADVTLVTDDKQQIRAHRNILSACSPVFKNILQHQGNIANPVIYLRGIQHSEMESIMHFIYLGEARFYEERMGDFLKVSKDLEIKNLSTGKEMTQTELNEKHENNREDIGEHTAQTFSENDANVEYKTKTESKPIIKNSATSIKVSTTKYSKYSCKQCDKQYTQQSNLTRHIESAHQGVKYACSQCDLQFTQQVSLALHIKSIHDGVKYPCNQCDHQAKDRGNLTKHIQSIHEGVKYSCDQCVYHTSRHDHLKTHLKRKHI